MKFPRRLDGFQELDQVGLLLLGEPRAEVTVVVVHHVAGEDCLMLKVRARDPQNLCKMLRIAGVQHTRTTIVLETIKESARLSIPVASALEEVAP